MPGLTATESTSISSTTRPRSTARPCNMPKAASPKPIRVLALRSRALPRSRRRIQLRPARSDVGFYQMSPNSGGYYTMTASHWPDRQIEAVTGVGLPTITYGATGNPGLDGEGRVTMVSASSGTNPVSGVTYNLSDNREPIGALLTACPRNRRHAELYLR